VVRLLGIREGVLEVDGLDVVDATPLLDIKPYVPQFDCHPAERIGWLQGRVESMDATRDDGRFSGDRRGAREADAHGAREADAHDAREADAHDAREADGEHDRRRHREET
jgi:hypothetical protein